MKTSMIAVFFAFVTIGVGGCTARQPVVPVPSFAAQTGAQHPDVLENGNQGGFVTFIPNKSGPSAAQYKGIVTGPDKNMWVIDQDNHALAKIDLLGHAHEFPLAAVSGSQLLTSMALGSDGKFYVLSGTTPGVVETMTTTGTSALISIPSMDSAYNSVTKGPDGNIWLTEFHHVGMITPAGIFTEYSYPAGTSIADGGDIVTGPDGNLWFAFAGLNAQFQFIGEVMKIVPSTGAMTTYSLAGVGCQYAKGIVNGSDGNLWVDCGAHLIRVDTSGNPTAFPVTAPGGLTNEDMTTGAGSLIWYVTGASGSDLVSFDVNTHVETDRSAPGGAGGPYHVTQGPDKNIWFTGVFFDPQSNAHPSVGIYLINVLKVTPKNVTLTVGQKATLTVTESGITTWTAKSSKTSVATVAAGQTNNTFVVTGVAAGTARITVKDALLNSYNVKITVQ